MEHRIDNMDHLSSNAKAFCKMLLHKPFSAYTPEQQNLALNIHYKSSSTYNFLRQRLHLSMPSNSSIYKWTPVKHVLPGFNETSLLYLRNYISSLPAKERHASLIIDAMSVRRELSYNGYHDKIVGYGDIGQDVQVPEFAKEVTVFMLRSTFGKWKCILSYYASASAIKGDKLKGLILKNVDMAYDIGVIVKTLITDQGTTNVNANTLLGVTIENPYFVHDTKKVFVLYDACHLIKSVRNSLIKNDIVTPDGIASWRVLRHLHDYEKCSVVKSCPKLTDRHLAPNSFEKMNVRLATQVLSHSCSAAVKNAVALNVFQGSEDLNKAIPTAIFLEKMDKLFDCLNSKNHHDKRKPHRSPLEKDGVVNDYLNDMKKFLIKVKSPANVKCFDGIKQSINAVLMLSTEYFESDDLCITQISTCKLNQDALENFFSQVRGHNGFNRNPSLREFNDIMGRIASMKSLGLTSSITNCEADDSEYIQQAIIAVRLANTDTTPSTYSDENYRHEDYFTDAMEEPEDINNDAEFDESITVQDTAIR